jgi:hypothetical protein
MDKPRAVGGTGAGRIAGSRSQAESRLGGSVQPAQCRGNSQQCGGAIIPSPAAITSLYVPRNIGSQPGSKLSRGELYLLGDGTNALSSCDDPDIGYLIGVGITLAPTIRSTPATYLAASIGWEMPTLLRGRQGSSATPQLRTILPFRDLGLLRVNPAVPASCPGFVLATSGSDQTAGGINGGVCRRRAYKAYFWQAGPARGWLSWIAGPIGRAISRLRRRRAVRRNRYK